MSKNLIKYQKTKSGDDASINDLLNIFSEFVGIEYKSTDSLNNEIIIHYPKSLGELPLSNKKENKKILLDFVKSLKLSKNIECEEKLNNDGENNIDRFPLFSYLWIWNDFKTHGKLIFNESINNYNSSGKINWKRTLEGNSLIYKDNVIYNDYVYKNKIKAENLLSEIYDYCVYKSLEMIIFLTNLSENFIHPLYKNIKKRKNKYISCLKEAIESTFDDEKKLRYNHMLNIVKALDTDSSINKNIFGIKSYAPVFEKEIDVMLGNVNDISKFYPEAFVNVEGVGEIKLSNLREDTIHIKNDECFIIDSKFYEFGNMPGASSIAKQIIYAQNIKTNHSEFKSDKIYNIFLIPRCFEDEKWNERIIRYHGYSYLKNQKDNYEKVHIYFIDLNYVLKNYKYGYNEKLFNKLYEDVHKRLVA